MTLSADQRWEQFVEDAADVLAVDEELHEAVPALVERPFDRSRQDNMRAVLDRLTSATPAASRLALTPDPIEGE